jgi:H+/gluconate symporter-like permease
MDSMIYELMGRAHALALRRGVAGEAGQGTVEYVGLILLVGVLLAGVVQASGGLNDNSIAHAVINKLKGAIDGVGGGAAAAPTPAPGR